MPFRSEASRATAAASAASPIRPARRSTSARANAAFAVSLSESVGCERAIDCAPGLLNPLVEQRLRLVEAPRLAEGDPELREHSQPLGCFGGQERGRARQQRDGGGHVAASEGTQAGSPEIAGGL